MTALTHRLLVWIRCHEHHAHLTGDGRICIGISAVTGDGSEFTAIEYVRSYDEARDALGY